MNDTCFRQEGHTHVHGPNCGHTAVMHDGHTDYIHEGRLHHMHGNHVDEHKLEIRKTNQNL